MKKYMYFSHTNIYFTTIYCLQINSNLRARMFHGYDFESLSAKATCTLVKMCLNKLPENE